ncbi:sigma factor-like helix-turn-helix DNA-binding protein [Streptosporangium sp. CA-135522]|uniref:sigma factor-like helix-turn-helix DNA-binding protein n=1 Tax=Streptosporangium sp. CA-135522 TaxID=3240072 RepID=UPI003D8ED1C9
MNDRVLVEALRARDPGALAALYDLHAESVYRYCWFMSGGPDGAQVALRDTLIAAEAHVHALADPDRLKAWLYALARGECVRRRLATRPDRGPADPVLVDIGDADLRATARAAVGGLSPEEREIVELVSRYGLSVADLAAVLGVTAKAAGTAYESARERLRDVVTAEVLVRRGPHDCASRARLLSGLAGELTPDARERVIRHVSRCDACTPHRTRQVSAAKVLGLLPEVGLPETLRVRVMSCFADPELVPYRRYVARRVGALDAAGFPIERVRRNRRRPYALVGAAVAVAAVAALALIFTQSVVSREGAIVGGARETSSGTGVPPGVRPPWSPDPGDAPMTSESRRGWSSVRPIGSIGPVVPIAVARDEPVPEWRVPTPTSTGRPPTGPDGSSGPTAPPVRPSPPAEPGGPVPVEPGTRTPPVLPGPPRMGTPQRPRPPRDHHGGRPPRPCRTTPGPVPTASEPASTPPKPAPRPTPTAPRPAPTAPRPAPTAPRPAPPTGRPVTPRPAPTASTPAPTDRPTAAPSPATPPDRSSPAGGPATSPGKPGPNPAGPSPAGASAMKPEA